MQQSCLQYAMYSQAASHGVRLLAGILAAGYNYSFVDIVHVVHVVAVVDYYYHYWCFDAYCGLEYGLCEC